MKTVISERIVKFFPLFLFLLALLASPFSVEATPSEPRCYSKQGNSLCWIPYSYYHHPEHYEELETFADFHLAVAREIYQDLQRKDFSPPSFRWKGIPQNPKKFFSRLRNHFSSDTEINEYLEAHPDYLDEGRWILETNYVENLGTMTSRVWGETQAVIRNKRHPDCTQKFRYGSNSFPLLYQESPDGTTLMTQSNGNLALIRFRDCSIESIDWKSFVSGQEVIDHRGDSNRLSKPYEFQFFDEQTAIIWFNLSANVYWLPVKYNLKSQESTLGPLLRYLLVPSPYSNNPVTESNNRFVVELYNGDTVPFSDEWTVITEGGTIKKQPWDNR